MVKEGSMFIKGVECIWMSPGKVEHYRRGSSAFLFVPEQLDISRGKLRLLIFYGYHLGVLAGVHMKLVSNGGC